jgi:hypothetical protein
MKTFDCDQRSAEWLAARRGIPTASRFDMIVTPGEGKPSTQQAKLIDTLLAEALLTTEIEEERSTADMDNGAALEDEARAFYELSHATGPVTQVGFCLADCGLFGGSPDALVGEDGGLELKCPLGSTHLGYVRSGKLPTKYRSQVHGHLLITGRKYWDFASYHRGLPAFVVRVVPDVFTQTLEKELHAFVAKLNAARAQFNLPPIGNP